MEFSKIVTEKFVPRPSVPVLNFVVGTSACNADCKFCISKLTEKKPIDSKLWDRNLELAFDTAKNMGANTTLITGKGEPMLEDIKKLQYIVRESRKRGFISELQTNGYLFNKKSEDIWGTVGRGKLMNLAAYGLNTLSVSRVATNKYYNDKYMGAGSPDLEYIADVCNEFGVNLRVCYVVFDVNHSKARMLNLDGNTIWAKQNNISQITLRRMGRPTYKLNTEKAKEVFDFVDQYIISDKEWSRFVKNLSEEYPIMRVYDWGSISFMINGVEVMVSDCLSNPGIKGTIRYLIYDGHMRISWEHPNAILF